MTRQYYFKQNLCRALSAHDADCICWHDEGTGVYAATPPPHLQWRDKPASPTDETTTTSVDNSPRSADFERRESVPDLLKKLAAHYDKDWMIIARRISTVHPAEKGPKMTDTARTEHIETFSKGNLVPEWLLSLDPRTPCNGRAAASFLIDVSVVKVWGRFWVIPEDMSGPSIVVDGGDVTGRQRLGLSNPNEPVVIPTATTTIGGKEGSTIIVKGSAE